MPEKTDPIQGLLAGLPPSLFMGNPAGTVAIMQSRVVEAGGDPEAVLAWVRAHGGDIDRSFPTSARRNGGQTLRTRAPSKPYYVIPQDALT